MSGESKAGIFKFGSKAVIARELFERKNIKYVTARNKAPCVLCGQGIFAGNVVFHAYPTAGGDSARAHSECMRKYIPAANQLAFDSTVSEIKRLGENERREATRGRVQKYRAEKRRVRSEIGEMIMDGLDEIQPPDVRLILLMDRFEALLNRLEIVLK